MFFTAHIPIFTYEVMMQTVPNFRPRGHGIYVYRRVETKEETECALCLYHKRKRCTLPSCPFIKDKIEFGTATKKQIMDAVFMNVRNSKFRERLSLFLNESEDNNMEFTCKRHECEFKKALESVEEENCKLVSAVYLLTADAQLWSRVRNQVAKNHIMFDRINLGSVSENAYALFCCAKDLYLGTKHITVSDLVDTQLISSKTFGVICNAMAVRRFGIGALCDRKIREELK